MATSVQYEILLKNGQFEKAAKESEKMIKDVGSAVNGAGSAYDNLSPKGKEVAENLRQMAEAQKSAAQGSASLRSQLKEVREELVAMEMAGKRGTEEFRNLQERAGKLQDAMSDASAQMRIMAHDQRGIQGVISGLTGLSGAMSATAGVVGMFAGENENLQKIMLKVQSLMAITVGLQQAQAALDKDSAFRLVTLNGLKEWWAAVVAKSSAAETAEVATLTANTAAETANAVATTAAGTAATASAGAFKILGVAIKSIPGIGWILAGISAVIAAASLVIKKHKENAAAQQKLIDEEIKKREELRKEIADAVGDNVSKMTELAASYKALGDDMERKKKFIKDNKNAFHDLGVEINGLEQADSLLIKNTDKFVKSEILKAKAVAVRAQATKLIKDNLDILNGSLSPGKSNGKYQLPGTTQTDYIKMDLENKLEKMFLEVSSFEQQAAEIMKPFTSPVANAVAKDTGKNEEEAKNQLLVGFKANYLKLLTEYKTSAEEIQKKVGTVDIINGVEFTYSESDIAQELSNLKDKFMEDYIRLRKQYGLTTDDIPEDNSEETKADVIDIVSIVDKLTGSLNGLGAIARNVVMKRLKELANFVKENKGNLTFSNDENASYFGISKDTLDNLLSSENAFELIQQKLDDIDKSDAITNLANAIKRLKKAKEDYQNSGDLIDEEAIAKAKDSLLEAIMQVKGALESSLKNLSNSFREIADMLDSDNLREVSDVMDAVLENVAAAEAGAQAWGGWWGAIIGGVTDLLPRVVSWITQENKLNKALKETNKELSILESQINEISTGGINEGNIKDVDKLYGDYINKQEELLYEYEKKNKNGKYDAEIAALRAQIARLKQEREDLWSDFYSDQYGLSATDIFSDLSDAIWDAFTNGTMAMDNFDQKFNELMVNVIKQKVLFNILGDAIDSFVNDIGEDMLNGGFDNGEDSQAVIEQYRQRWNEMVTGGMQGLEELNALFDSLGAFGASADSLSGSIQSITSEQAGILAGQMNAMRIEQMSHTDILTNQLMAMYDIERNTRYIRDIYSYMRGNGVAISNNSLNRAYGQN